MMLTNLLVFFIVIIALIFVLSRMRAGRGCCGGHTHEHKDSNDVVKDPVCGMEVTLKSAAASRVHQGTPIFFCSTHCAEKFDQDPTRYTESNHGDGSCCGGQGGKL